MVRIFPVVITFAHFGLLVGACGAHEPSNTSSATGGRSGSGGGGHFATGGTTASTGGSIGLASNDPSASDELPDESEAAPSFGAPVVTGKYLWSANSESGRVALIDAESLTTRVVPAGLFPTHLAALPDDPQRPSALVLNTGSSDATLLRLEGEQIHTEHVRTHVGANRWAVGPNGRYAAAWSTAASEDLDPTEGLQELTLVELAASGTSSKRLTVGYRPERVLFDDEGQRLIVVARRGVSLIDPETQNDTWVDLAEATGRDVSVTPDGKYILASRPDSPDVELVPLDAPEDRVVVTLPGAVTDLDLADAARAVAVVREQSLVATFVVDEVLSSPTAVDTQVISGELVGSAEITRSGQRAVLFTNAVERARVTVVSLKAGEDFLSYRTISSQAPVESITIAPDGAHAIAVGHGLEGASSGSFSILSLSRDRFPRVIGTDAPVEHVALANDFGVVTATQSNGQHEAHLVSFEELSVQGVHLPSPPISTGVVEEQRIGFVSQRHPEGRVTFFDFSEPSGDGLNGQTRTLTGFELSAEVVE